jgi:mandelate racemase
MADSPRLTVSRLRAIAVEVPMTYVLGTSRGAFSKAPLILIDLETEEGIIGRSYLWCYVRATMPAIVSALAAVAEMVKGDRVAPPELWRKLSKRFALMGVQGIVRMAMAGLDVAAWDAVALAEGKPLATLLGAQLRPIPAYNSCGLGPMERPELVADEAEKLLAGGFKAVKLRLGYPTLEADLAAVRAVRARIPREISLMVDYNQALTVEEAVRRGRALDGEGVYWMEEPIRHDDHAGCASVARALSTPVQIGENFSLVHDMERALAAEACDYVMPDLERIGGATGWQRAAELARARDIRMSSHLYPEVSAHLLAVTPTAHWLEYVDWANAIVEEPLRIVAGNAIVPDRPGNGLVWNDDAVRRFRMN